MKTDRLLSIILLLLEKDKIIASDLAQIYEVSKRTIYRDIETISMAGIPVVATPGVNGGFEILPRYKVDKKVFSASELSAILLGLSNISYIINPNGKAEIANAVSKIKSLVPEDSAEKINLKVSQIHVDFNPWYGNKNVEENFRLIKVALEENRIVSFEYIDNHGKRSARKAEPYQLVLKNSQWYIQCFCLLKNEFRLFKLSRIISLNITQTSFIPRSFENSNLFVPKKPITDQTMIKLKIDKSILDRILDFCPPENLKPYDSKSFIVDFPFIESDWYYDLILGFGPKCECLEPANVRNIIKERIFLMEKNYR